jgi:hypothetical protein
MSQSVLTGLQRASSVPVPLHLWSRADVDNNADSCPGRTTKDES